MSSERLWFKKKKFGWGWTPCTWEGWLVTLLHIGLAFLISFRMIAKGEENISLFVDLYIPIGLLMIILIGISWQRGEKQSLPWQK